MSPTFYTRTCHIEILGQRSVRFSQTQDKNTRLDSHFRGGVWKLLYRRRLEQGGDITLSPKGWKAEG